MGASFEGLTQESEVCNVPDWPASIRLSTDKHLYRPGQTLHMRLLSLASDGAAAASQECSLQVTDPRNDRVFAVNLTTSDFGIAHADWPTPDRAQSGNFAIQADCEDASSSSRVQIRPYELPSFRVLATPDQTFYLPGQQRKLTVSAEYLFGKALTAGHVRSSQTTSPPGTSPSPRQTADGHTAETATDIRSFLPFSADLDPPPLLTVGDQVNVPILIRNYTGARQSVTLNITAPPQLTAWQLPPKQTSVEPQATSSETLALRADAASNSASIRFTAHAQKQADSIERPIAIQPDGRLFERTANDSLANPTLKLSVPPNAIPGSLYGELKLYPSILATVLESAKSLLTKPAGCGTDHLLGLRQPALSPVDPAGQP